VSGQPEQKFPDHRMSLVNVIGDKSHVHLSTVDAR